jgi:lipoate-protein ligase A
MTSQEWLLVDSGPGAAHFNMALDEALLGVMPRLGRPLLRFYGWTEPAASFGYFQKYSEVERLTQLRPLIRRPTGGGIVPHDKDWTYSVMFPTSHEWYSVSARESYQRIHQWLQAAFVLVEIEAELASAAAKTRMGECFAGFEQFDLLWNERKIAGAAQRRRRDGLLIQGSVQPPEEATSRGTWQKAVCAAGEKIHTITWRAWMPDKETLASARELSRTKYSKPDYNEGR